MTNQQAALEEQCRAICSACREGLVARYRPETGEWVHDRIKKLSDIRTQLAHFICQASKIRNGVYVERTETDAAP